MPIAIGRRANWISDSFRAQIKSQAFSFDRVWRAIMRDAVIVVGRGRGLWFGAVPELADHGKVLSLACEPRFTLSPGNVGDQGFEQFCTALEAA
jgi:hypothetical protein